ncbi:MAG: CHC2 zinc finger domain-containing protein [Anaerolineae bacterium]|nr:CHC2 zinc finger domain-containing protein [Anaerolineae bacterium]
MGEREKEVTENGLFLCAGILARRFFQRWDLYAQQLDNGRYLCIHESLTTERLIAHLQGEITLGTYILNTRDEARFMVFDADDAHGFNRLAYLAERLANEEIPSYLEASRRGGHLWLFFRHTIPGKQAREIGLGIQSKHNIEQMEVFPKQYQLGDGPGSLIRLPFGIHRSSGERYPFYDFFRKSLGNSVTQQILYLQHIKYVSPQTLEKYTSLIPTVPEREARIELPSKIDSLADRVKASVNAIDFLSNYIELTPTSSGAVGLCPLHDDHNPSLGVNETGNYWHCFAGCGGGSIIEFWMKWRGLDFRAALSELAKKLLLDLPT